MNTIAELIELLKTVVGSIPRFTALEAVRPQSSRTWGFRD